MSLRPVLFCVAALATIAACNPEKVCVPGAQVTCACEQGTPGTQICDADGSGLGPCRCGAGGEGGRGGSGGSGGSTAAPVLVIVQDRSGSMNQCFGAAVAGSHSCTRTDGSGEADGRLSRMGAFRRVITGVVEESAARVRFGLSVFGDTAGGKSCGPGKVLVEPEDDSARKVVDAYAQSDDLLTPAGGTPTAAGLSAAHELLVDEAGHLRSPDRKAFVLLVTDGLMNCNVSFPADQPCICPNEAGCTLDGEHRYAFGEEIGVTVRRDICLDLDATAAQVERLREAGVTTYVVGVAETFSGGSEDLGVRSLNQLAIAGGAPRDGEVRFFPAGGLDEMQSSLSEILRQVTR